MKTLYCIMGGRFISTNCKRSFSKLFLIKNEPKNLKCLTNLSTEISAKAGNIKFFKVTYKKLQKYKLSKNHYIFFYCKS